MPTTLADATYPILAATALFILNLAIIAFCICLIATLLSAYNDWRER